MKLYHGTFEDSYVSIVKSGVIRCDATTCDTTDLLNEIIEKYLGEDLCKGCIFLSDNIEATDAYDYAFDVDTDNLNLSLLWVGDNRLKDDMLIVYHSTMGSNRKNKRLKELVDAYYESFISFEDYLKNKEEYDSKHYAEFLYFGDINVEITEEDLEIAENYMYA